MKNIFKLITVIFTLSFLTACQDFTEVNKNPNNVSQTHPQLLLTDIEVNALQVQGKGPLYATRMIVQSDEENSNQYFKWGRSSFDIYDQLRQVTKMIQEANRINDKGYLALGKFFRAYYFYNLTLTFGDVPYKQALQGEIADNYTPEYSSQKDIFIGILNELEEANSLLSSYSGTLLGDVVYSGNSGNWRRLVNSFRLNVLMTLSKRTTELNVKNQFNSIYQNEPIINSTEQNAKLVFIDQQGSRYTEFNDSGYGSGMYMSSTFVDELKTLKDPRLFIFADRTKKAKEGGLEVDDFNAYQGGNPIKPYNETNILATKGEVSKVNSRYYKNPTTEPHNLMSFSQVQFILAEAAVRGWINADAKSFYNKGIESNFEFYNTYATQPLSSYVDHNAYESYMHQNTVVFDDSMSQEEKLKLILTQKYITSFLQGGWRSYFDNLRTGYPVLVHQPGATPPTRWMYPLSEYNTNTENVSKAINSQFGQGNDKIRSIPWWLK